VISVWLARRLGGYLLGPGVRLYEEFVVDDDGGDERGVGDVFL
jgi:hypothetical protein